MNSPSADPGRLQCPYCDAFEIDRLYLASLAIDSCVCSSCGARWDQDEHTHESSCGARWDQDAATGEFRGRASHARTSRTHAG